MQKLHLIIGASAVAAVLLGASLHGTDMLGARTGLSPDARMARFPDAVMAPVSTSLQLETTAAATRTAIGDSLRFDITRSIIRWRGTKFRGRRHHEGTVHLAAGTVAICGEAICGGHFIIDMTSIQVTDIPVSQPEPRQQLTEHLKSRDFFWSEQHPTASFRLRSATEGSPGIFRVVGDLTIRGVTRSIAFPATVSGRPQRPARIEARFRIDRQDWGISYRFDPIRNELVDDEIDFHLTLIPRESGE